MMGWLSLVVGLGCSVPERITDVPPSAPLALLQEVPRGCVGQQTWAELGSFTSVWTSASGVTYALGARGVARRDVDGTWNTESIPEVAYGLEGEGDEVWAWSPEGLLHRTEDGWLAVPPTRNRARGLTLVDGAPTRLMQGTTGPRVVTWNGETWFSRPVPAEGAVALDTLPDDRLVIASPTTVYVEHDRDWQSLTAPVSVEGMEVGSDGTIVVWDGASALAVGNAERGLDTVLDVAPVVVHDAWVGGANDLWIVGASSPTRDWVLHYDGDTWNDLASADPLVAVSGGPRGVLAAGGASRRVVFRVEEERLALDRSEFGIDGLNVLAVDDVTGTAHAAGEHTVAIDTGTGWVGAPSPLPTPGPDHLAATAGRLAYGWVLGNASQLVVFEPGEPFVGTQWGGLSLRGLVGRDGVLYAFGERGNRPWLATHTTDGWDEVSTEGLPDLRTIGSLWADRPGRLWVSVHEGARWSLARLDGDTWTHFDDHQVINEAWIGRMEGALWYTTPEGVAQWTRRGPEPVDALPNEPWRVHAIGGPHEFVLSTTLGFTETTLWGRARNDAWMRLANDVDWRTLDGTSSTIWTTSRTGDWGITLACR